MQYCKECVTPSTRPGLQFDGNGVCSACNSAKIKVETDWDKRRSELEVILDRHRRKHDHDYDCLIPVSGGKDSCYQVHVIKNDFGMNPLCVSFRPLSRTLRGEANLQALRDIGVDHIDFAPNPKGINTLTRRAFEEFGDCSLVDHLAIYGLVPNLSIRFNLPLVIWGENPYMEYGGGESQRNLTRLNRQFFREHHIIKGREVEDWVDDDLPLRELASFRYPSQEALDAINYDPVFLGCYIPWDAAENLRVALIHNFRPREAGAIMGLYDYADLDCMNIVIHHYFKWLKFGFNRVTDQASNEIRKGRMSREKGIELIRELDGYKPPKEYIRAFCKQIAISEERFWQVAERFRNRDIWKQNSNGEWYIEGWLGGDSIPDRFPHTSLNENEKQWLKIKGVLA